MSPGQEPTKVGERSRRVFANTVVQVIGKSITSLLGIISVGILTRYLGVENYGVYTLVFAYLSFFQSFSDLGLSLIGVREIAKDDGRTRDIMEAVFLIRMILALLSILLAIGLSFFLYPGGGRAELRTGIAIISLGTFFSVIGSAPVTYYQAKLKMIYATLSDVAGRVVALGLLLIVLWQRYSLATLFWTVAISYGVTAVSNMAFARGLFSRLPRPGLSLIKNLVRESAPLGLAMVINTIYFRVDSVILSLFRSDSEVGLYNLSYRILEILAVLFGYFTASAFPVISGDLQSDKVRFRLVVQKTFNFILLISVPSVVGIFLLSKPIILILGGPDFSPARASLRILTFATGLIFLNSFPGLLIIAANRQKSALWINFTALAVNVILNLIFIPRYGFIAAAWVTLLSELVVMVLAAVFVKKYFGFLPNLAILPRILIAVVPMSAVLIGLKNLLGSVGVTVLLSGVAGALVYGVGLILSRAVGLSDIAAILKLDKTR